MKLYLSLASSLVELVAFLGKWLFIVASPVLLIVTNSYYQAGKSCHEPLAGLVLVSGMFALTNWLRMKLDVSELHNLRNDPEEVEVKFGKPSAKAELWNRQLEEDRRRQVSETVATCRNGQRQTEMWRQANPWGGYNPFE